MEMEILIRSIAEGLQREHGLENWDWTYGYDNIFWVRFEDGSQFTIDIRQTKKGGKRN